MPKGLTLYVCRPADFPDCTNGGISSRHDRLTVVGYVTSDGTVYRMPRESQVFEPTEAAPPVLLKVRYIGSPILSIVPAEVDTDGDSLSEAPGWHMFGGNYASITDSRFGDLAHQITGQRFYGAVAIHDRVEDL